MYPIFRIVSRMVGYWTLWQVRASLGGEKTQLLTEMVWLISTVFIFISCLPHEPYRNVFFAMVCNSSAAVLWSFKDPFWRLQCNNATRLHYVAVTRTCSANWPIGRRDTSQSTNNTQAWKSSPIKQNSPLTGSPTRSPVKWSAQSQTLLQGIPQWKENAVCPLPER